MIAISERSADRRRLEQRQFARDAMDAWDEFLSLLRTDDDIYEESDEVSSQEWFADAVWDAMGMDVEEFLRRLDVGEFEELMENEEYRHLRQLAQMAERFR